MQASFFKRNATYIWIIVGFMLIAFLYCYPQLQGKRLSVHDTLSWEAASHEIHAYKDSTHIDGLWTNCMFGGMPAYTIGLTGVNNYVQTFQVAIQKFIPDPAFMFFCAMLSFFMLSCTLRINKWIGAIGAIAYAFATYNPVIISAGHVTKMYAIGVMPGVLAGFLLLFGNRKWIGVAAMALFFSLMMSAAHYQIIYYTGIMLVIAGIVIGIHEIRKGRVKNFILSGLIASLITGLCLGPVLPAVLTTAEYTKYTMRGGASELKQLKKGGEQKTNGGLDKEYAFRWSNGIGETFCFMIPQLYGGASGQDIGTNSKYFETLTGLGLSESQAESMSSNVPLYWGPQPFLSGPVYFGAIICFLFVLGTMIIRSVHKWWIVGTCIIAVVMSWGNHFEGLNYFLFDHLPMYNKFRVPSMILVLPQLLFPLLGVWALNEIVQKKIANEELLKKLKLSALITAGICVVLGIGGQMFFDFSSANDASLQAQYVQMASNNPEVGKRIMNALIEDRASVAMKSALYSAFLILATFGILWAFIKERIKINVAIGAIAILVAIDMLPTAQKYLNKENFLETEEYEAKFRPRPVDAEILKDKDPYYRVFDLSVNTYNDAMQSYHHKTVGGYSAAKMESYQDLIDVHLSGPFNKEVLNMLNTKYVIFNGGANGQPVFQVNNERCGNGWFVSNVHYVNNADEEMKAMNAPALGDTTQSPNGWHAAETAVIRKNEASIIGNKQSFAKDSNAHIVLDKYGLNELLFTSQNAYEGLAVFSDIYYDKGWKAYIDGKEAPIVKANYVLRAISIPAGSHKIKFEFKPDTYYKYNKFAAISSVLIYLLLGAGIYFYFRKEKDLNPDDSSAV